MVDKQQDKKIEQKKQLTQEKKVKQEVSSQKIESKKPKASPIKNWVMLWPVAFLLLVGVFVYVYAKLAKVTQKLYLIENKQQQEYVNITNNLTQLQQQLQQGKDDYTNLAEQLTTVSHLSQVESSANPSWQFNEINYVVELANLNLQEGGNAKTALALLEYAQEKVAKIDNGQWLILRQALQTSVTQVKSSMPVSAEQSILQLRALSNQIERLPVKLLAEAISEKQNILKQEPVEIVTREDSLLQKLWQSLKLSLANLVKIRRVQEPLLPLLTSNDRQLLVQNVSWLLARAQWAVLNQQQTLFQTSLTDAKKLVEQYFETTDSSTQDFIAQLSMLQQERIVMEFVSLNRVFQALQALDKRQGENA